MRTLGFRGEALASIAEVSRLVIRSRTADADSGAELEVVGGAAQPVVAGRLPGRHDDRGAQPVLQHAGAAQVPALGANRDGPFDRGGHAAGARPPADPFHARRTTAGWCTTCRRSTSIRERIAAFFGDELADDLIEIDSENDGVTLSGYVANPMHSRATGRMQYLFLNGRAIRDRALQHALGEAYRGLLLTGRQPICFLRLDMPPELVDVNVHPTKQEVRFQDSGRLYSQLLGTLRTKFLTTDLTARGAAPAGATAASARWKPTMQRSSARANWSRGPRSSWANRLPSERSTVRRQTMRPNRVAELNHPHEPLRLHRFDAAGVQAVRHWAHRGQPPADVGELANRSDSRAIDD